MNRRSWGAVQPFGRSLRGSVSAAPFPLTWIAGMGAWPARAVRRDGSRRGRSAQSGGGPGCVGRHRAGVRRGRRGRSAAGSGLRRERGAVVPGSDGAVSIGAGATGRLAVASGRGPSLRWRPWCGRPWWRRLIGWTDGRRSSRRSCSATGRRRGMVGIGSRSVGRRPLGYDRRPMIPQGAARLPRRRSAGRAQPGTTVTDALRAVPR